MAEYDKGRYYWIKLTDRFMTSDTVDFLMSQKDGANYVVLYQMLCLKTVNNDGIMARQIGEMIVPYDVDKIQRDCKWFPIDTVRIALELYKKLGLIYENNDGVFAISNFDRMIGSQTFGAERKELQKARGGKKVENFPPDKEIKRIRDKEKEKDTYKPIHNNNGEIADSIKRENAVLSSEFEELWKLYPNKQGKESARNHYIKARKDGATKEEIEDGIKRYSQYCKAKKLEKRYIKHGSTWFTNKSWQDDYEPTEIVVETPKYTDCRADDAMAMAIARSYDDE